jgi:hypothetical protein
MSYFKKLNLGKTKSVKSLKQLKDLAIERIEQQIEVNPVSAFLEIQKLESHKKKMGYENFLAKREASKLVSTGRLSYQIDGKTVVNPIEKRLDSNGKEVEYVLARDGSRVQTLKTKLSQLNYHNNVSKIEWNNEVSQN